WRQFPQGSLSAVELRDLQTQTTSFQALAAWRFGGGNVTGDGAPEHLRIGRCTANFFPLLGVPPQLGRWVGNEGDQPGGKRVLILTYGLWQRQFGGDPNVIGRSVDMDGVAFTVVGVLPARFSFPGDFQMWAPLRIRPADFAEERRGNRGLRVIGRLAPA